MSPITKVPEIEKRLIKIGEWLNTQGFDLDLSDSFWMEDCRFGEHKVRDIAELLDDFCNQEVEKRIKERIPSEECIASEARKRFTSNMGVIESAKYQGFIRCGKWLRSRLSQKTEGGGE